MAKEPFAKIIPKPRPKVPGWVNFLFYCSLFLLIILLAGFLFLETKNSSFKKEKESLQSQLAEVKGAEEKDLEEKLSEYQEKIKVFQELFKEHKISSNFFSFIENLCHPKVQFTKLDLNAQNYQANLEGETESFQSLGEQFFILAKNENIKNLNLANVLLGKEGKVEFSLTFSFSSDILTKK